MIKKIIVLGGSGFLGSNIIKSLKEESSLNVFCGDLVPNEEIECEFIKIDLLKISDVKNKLMDFDVVINCTGQVSKPFNTCLNLNSIGINNLIISLKDTNTRIIQTSTVSVYGSIDECDESSPLNPETRYGTAKAFAEKILLENYNNDKLLILRLPNLYGSKQTQGVFAYIIRSYKSDKKLYFNNNGYLKRTFMHVEDCADIFREFVKESQTNHIFNIKGYETYTLKQLIQKFENRFNIQFHKEFKNILPLENIANLSDIKFRSIIKTKPSWNTLDYFSKELDC